MKKIIFILAFCITTNAIAQQGWFQQNSGTSQSFTSVFFLNEQTGFVCGGFRIFKTTNGGTSWTETILSDTTILMSIRFLNTTTGFACGGRYINEYVSHQHLFRTTNSGQSWIKINQNSGTFTNEKYNDVYPVDSLVYLTMGGYGSMSTVGSMYVANNYGTNFSNINLTYYENILKLSFINSNTGWVTTNYGTDVPYAMSRIFKTTNRGQNWIMQFADTITAGEMTPIYGMQFFNSNTGYALYAKRKQQITTTKFMKTSNGGSSWDSLIVPYDIYNSMYFADANTGWLGGKWNTDSIMIIRTTNGGTNWHAQKKAANAINSIHFVNNMTGWAVGNDGLILKTVSGGVTNLQNISSEIPTSFSLGQNYPNPFNPSTTIKFDIPKSANVKISVFDITGKEIETLVNEKLNAGTYQTEWNGMSYSSGVYFYKMITNNYTETKRMLLIK